MEIELEKNKNGRESKYYVEEKNQNSYTNGF